MGRTDANTKTGFVDPYYRATEALASSQTVATIFTLFAARRRLASFGTRHANRLAILTATEDLTIRFADAGADQRENAAIVLGKSIGGVSLGELRDAVEAFYGSPRQVAAKRRGLLVATYRLHGGFISISYVGKSVVGVATNSNYYAGKSGLGAGAPVRTASAAGLRGGGCKGSLQRTMGSVIVSAVARNNRVLSISMMQRRHATC